MTKDISIRNNLLAITACLLWATAFVFTKITLEYLPPLTVAGIRFLLAGLIQIPLCTRLVNPLRLLRTETSTVLWLSLFQTILLYAAFFYAMTFVQGAQAAIVIGAGPLISAIAAHISIHDDKLDRHTLQGIILGITGIIIISLATKPWEPIGMKEFYGILVLLAGSIVSAVGNIIVSKKRGALPAIDLNCIQMLIGGSVLLGWAILAEGVPSLRLPFRFYGSLSWLAFVSAAGFAIWFHLLSRVKVSKLNIWKFLIPLAGAGLSWVLIPDESPDLPTLAGMTFIIFSIFRSQRGTRVSTP